MPFGFSIFGILISYCLIYLFCLFVFSTQQFLLNKSISINHHLLSLFPISYSLLVYIIKFAAFEKLYCSLYYPFSAYCGYLFYNFFTAIIIRIIHIYINIPSSIGIPILYGVPVLFCFYGIINSIITKIIKINLKFPGYKGKTTILHLSDIHLGAIYQKSSIEKIVKETKKINPDIVVITGDMADGSLKVKADWLKPFDELTMPILYITGNHEEYNPKKDMITVVEMTKIKYIGNHGRFKFKNINFIGEDYKNDLNECLSDIIQEEGVPNVLLYHVPNMKPEEIGKYNIFLELAGHTHGGQIFPLHIFIYLGNACFSGLYSDKENKHHVFVSEGINSSSPPMRIGCSRIYGLITIEGK